jgi:hypothetical protein
LGLGYRWLQPLDEQIQYYPQAANVASASLLNLSEEYAGGISNANEKASGKRRLFDLILM